MKYQAPIDAVNEDDPYVDLDVVGGVDGSPVPAAAIEHPMREIMHVIEEAGIVPDEADLTQLHAAILALAGNGTYASNAESTLGVEAEKALTPANFGSQQSLLDNGYQKLPGGLILQWGIETITTDTHVVVLPLVFPNKHLAFVPIGYDSATVDGPLMRTHTRTLTGISIEPYFEFTSDSTEMGLMSETTITTTKAVWMSLGY